MSKRTYEILAHDHPIRGMIKIYVFADEDGKGYILRDSGFKHLEDGVIEDPTLIIDRHVAQSLVDDLWKRCGIRPTDDNTETLVSTKAHLADMRRIALAQLSLEE